MAGPSDTTFYPAVLERIQREYAEVYTFAFRPEAPLPFLPGHHVHLPAPGAEICKPMVRHMSVASSPADELLEFTMDLSSGTPYKLAFRAAELGQTCQIFKIGGDFTLEPGDVSPIVFVAGGIGITPIRSLIRHLEQTGRPRPWTLLHVSRDAFLYQEELTRLPFPQHRVGRAQVQELLARLVADQPGATFYLCGSRGFLEGIGGSLRELGLPPERIRTEDFR